MKKLLVALLVAVSCISCVGCGSTNNENSNNSQQEESEVYTKGRLYYEEIETAFSVLKKI